MDQMYKKLKLTTISELIKNIYCSLSVIIIGCASAYAVEFNKDLIEAEDRENVNLSQFETDGQLPVGKYSLSTLINKEVAIKWSAAPDMTPQTVLYRRPVAQFSNFQPKIVSSWLILALFQANFLISGRSRLCPYQLVNSNQVRQGE